MRQAQSGIKAAHVRFMPERFMVASGIRFQTARPSYISLTDAERTLQAVLKPSNGRMMCFEDEGLLLGRLGVFVNASRADI